ncbi:MAG: hypothetical protein Q7T55_12625 [Solirubrobacteraceae bacterium]|nr:hypothetical protein [Solirubrobacteraceae bacterium]
MADEPKTKPRDAPASARQKTCFVVSEFGKTPEQSARTKQVLRHLIQKVLEPMGYSVVRADGIDDEGLITHQIIEHLLDDDLVIADLTNHNANVFYEVAVRHAARKPIVHVMTHGEQIPFDVANMRTVHYALNDPDLLEEAQHELRRKVETIEEGGFKAAHNPITAARDVSLLKESDKPELQEAGAILEALADIRSDLQSFNRPGSSSKARGISSMLPRAQSISRYAAGADPALLEVFMVWAMPRATERQLQVVSMLAEGPQPADRIAAKLDTSPATLWKETRLLRERGIVSASEGDTSWTLTLRLRTALETGNADIINALAKELRGK